MSFCFEQTNFHDLTKNLYKKDILDRAHIRVIKMGHT